MPFRSARTPAPPSVAPPTYRSIQRGLPKKGRPAAVEPRRATSIMLLPSEGELLDRVAVAAHASRGEVLGLAAIVLEKQIQVMGAALAGSGAMVPLGLLAAGIEGLYDLWELPHPTPGRRKQHCVYLTRDERSALNEMTVTLGRWIHTNRSEIAGLAVAFLFSRVMSAQESSHLTGALAEIRQYLMAPPETADQMEIGGNNI